MHFSFFFSIVILFYLFFASNNLINGDLDFNNLSKENFNYFKLIFIFFIFYLIILVYLISIPFLCLIISPSLILLNITFRIIGSLTIYDFLFCITGKYVLENKIFDYTSYSIFLFSLIIGMMIISTIIQFSHNVFGQISIVGAFVFTKVNNLLYSIFIFHIFHFILFKLSI
jgi:hypothetical protein